jgi:hypothetical protein
MSAKKAMLGSENDPEVRLRVRVREFALPPVRDALVIGRQSPVGCVALQRALALLTTDPFESIEIADHPTISDLIVRRRLLLRIPRDQLIQFVIQRIAPLMGDNEVLHLDLEVEVEMEVGM